MKALAIVTLILVSLIFNALTIRQLAEAREDVATLEQGLDAARLSRSIAHRLIERTYRLDSVGEEVTYMSLTVTASAYTARAIECDDSPETTADNTPSRIGLLAVSPDLRLEMGLRFGEVVLLMEGDEALGVFQIRDSMNSRYRRRVDVLHGNVEAARLFGVRKNITLFKVLDKGSRP